MSRFPLPFPFRKEGQVSLSDLQEEMNNLFQRLWHSGLSTGPFDGQDWGPTVDVLEEADRFVVRAEVPGLDAADIELTYVAGALTLRGEKRADYDEESASGMIRRERRYGRFCRDVPLPASADASKISASCHNGVLEVTVKKTAESQAKAIKIDVIE
jgi:HSP20 family protein